MSVQLNPEQAEVVGEAIRAGLIETPDDIVKLGVEAIRRRLAATAAKPLPSPAADALPVHVRAKDLVELFADSPFKGADLQTEPDASFFQPRTIQQLISEQGANPITDVTVFAGAIPDEDVDEFVADIYRSRFS